jgi:hypothetical protein
MIDWPIEIIENKYARWYKQIVTRAKSRTLSNDVYTEKHHVIPKSIGGTNLKDNLVVLTAREHFICHWLLIKFTTGRFKLKMAAALSMMHRTNNDQINRYKSVNFSRIYQSIKILNSEFASDRNSGRTYSPEAKARMSEAQKKAYRETWTPEMKARRNAAVAEANRNRVYTDEMRANRSKGLKGIKRSPEYCEMLSKRSKGKKLPPLSAKTKKKISEKTKGANNPNAKTWEIISPEGNIYTTTGNLKELCSTLPISIDSIKTLASGKKDQIKGWQAKIIPKQYCSL